MTIVADILLVAGAFAAAFYCFVLGRRLRRFNDLESGVGGAVAVLSAQVDDLEKSLASARASAQVSSDSLLELVERSENVRRQLELQMASLHDVIPDEPTNLESSQALSNPAADTAQPMFTRHKRAS